MSNPCVPNFIPRHKALRSIATASWGPTKRISLPTLQSLCPSGAHICLSWMVPIPLQHCNQSPGSSTQSCMQGHYWLPLFHPLLTTPSRGPTPSSKADSRASDPPTPLNVLCAFPPDFSSLYGLAIKNVPCRLKKKPFWRSFCSSATQPLPSPRESLITCFPFPPWSTTHFTVSPLHSRLHKQQYSPTPNCFKQTILPPPPLISKYGLMDLSPPFSVPVALESMQHAPNATHPIPYPFPPVQLPPASQLKPLPSSKVLLGVLAI